MSVSMWAYTPEKCDGDFCIGECDICNKADGTEYKYGMKLRGFSIGCQPMKGLCGRKDDPFGKYWDVLVYDRKLTEEEMNAYDLEFIERS